MKLDSASLCKVASSILANLASAMEASVKICVHKQIKQEVQDDKFGWNLELLNIFSFWPSKQIKKVREAFMKSSFWFFHSFCDKTKFVGKAHKS